MARFIEVRHATIRYTDGRLTTFESTSSLDPVDTKTAMMYASAMASLNRPAPEYSRGMLDNPHYVEGICTLPNGVRYAASSRIWKQVSDE